MHLYVKTVYVEISIKDATGSSREEIIHTPMAMPSGAIWDSVSSWIVLPILQSSDNHSITWATVDLENVAPHSCKFLFLTKLSSVKLDAVKE